MHVRRVFNNNVVLGVGDDGGEVVLVGRGLGFQARPGDVVQADRIEKRFVPGEGTGADGLAALVQQIPAVILEVTAEVVAQARARLGPAVADHAVVALADHIALAVERAREGVAIEYPLRWEVERLYPAEVEAGREALALVAQATGVDLPELEAVPLALHFVNAQFGAGDMGGTMARTAVIGEVVELVAGQLDVPVDPRSAALTRFVSHLRALLLRELDDALLDGDAVLLDAVRAAHPRHLAVAEKVGDLLRDRFGWQPPDAELVHLSLHIRALQATAQASPGPA